MILRLILGDQLNPLHSWFTQVDENMLYVMMEIRSETDYVLHHGQKILAIFAAMRDFAKQLKAQGHRIKYFTIDAVDNQHNFVANLKWLVTRYQVQTLQYQEPDEWRVDQQLSQLAKELTISVEMCDSEHFFSQRDSVSRLFQDKKQWLMERFYRQMRLEHHILIDEQQQPIGGQWNFDHDNRKPWRGQPILPKTWPIHHQHSQLWQTIQQAGVNSFGQVPAEDMPWPINRAESLTLLRLFIKESLPYFGDYQDAMTVHSERLFHSLLSFALNCKMLQPKEVVAAAIYAYEQGQASLSTVEGFVRQILGWREYVRGVYWATMPQYADHNYFQHHRDLPTWFWTGQTHMRCLAHAIGQSLTQAYAHHIQRLMVIGNFALLAGLKPQAVHQWYLGVYIDAFEWVELPNTLGMSQFADGGHLATKPYVSSASYIDKMSDYCQGCHYNKKQRIGEKACPFNSLYWHFFIRHQELLSKNPRLGIVYKQVSSMTEAQKEDINQQADVYLRELDNL